MNCDQCGAADPLVHLTEIRDGRKTERHLCLPCASKEAGVDASSDLKTVLTAWVSRHQANPPNPPRIGDTGTS